jgi:hypothetical protein
MIEASGVPRLSLPYPYNVTFAAVMIAVSGIEEVSHVT